jgi:thioredoxin-dependent peroxiredoxin
MVNEGDKAPPFELEADGAAHGKHFSLTQALKDGSALVLYFYPRDNTPGCTREAQAFAEAKKKLAAAGATVAGVSKDSIKSHCGFREKYGLSFPLLSDPDLAVHRAYGAYGEKTMYGKKVLGTIRSTFVIGSDGRIVRAWRGVRVDGHVGAVLDALGSGPAKAAAASAKIPPKKTAAPAKKKKKTTAKKTK